MSALLRLRQKHFLGLEAVVASLPAVALLAWTLWLDGTSLFDAFLDGNRINIYGTVATIAGTLLGFSLAAASFVMSLTSSPRLAVLRQSPHFPTLWKTFFQAVRFLGALVLTSLVCLTWDKDDAPNTWLLIPFVLFVGLSIIRMARVIWMLEQIIHLVLSPRKDSPLS